MATQIHIRIEGETYLTLEAISQCYGCEAGWLREVYEFGLLGGGRVYSGSIVLRVTVLDRVAEVVRLARYHDLGFEMIALLLGDVEDEIGGRSE